MQGVSNTPREPSIVSRSPGGAPNSARSNVGAKASGGKGGKVLSHGERGRGNSDGEGETQIRELQETVEILELKVAKLEQLVRLKDTKLQKDPRRQVVKCQEHFLSVCLHCNPFMA